MKSKLLYFLMSLLVVGSFWSCDDDSTEGMTRITYYAQMTLNGDDVVYVNLGDSYNEEGCVALINGQDVSENIEISSNVNTSKVGIYTVTYTVLNEDGFPANAQRQVYVIDPTSIATLYWGESMYGAKHYYNAPIYITDNGDGTYHVDDLMGGFQFYGLNPGFEPAYDFHAEADFKINDDNTVTQVGETGNWYFAASAGVALKDGTFDPATRTFNFSVSYGSGTLTVILVAISK